jgi:hypothetical protein
MGRGRHGRGGKQQFGGLALESSGHVGDGAAALLQCGLVSDHEAAFKLSSAEYSLSPFNDRYGVLLAAVKKPDLPGWGRSVEEMRGLKTRVMSVLQQQGYPPNQVPSWESDKSAEFTNQALINMRCSELRQLARDHITYPLFRSDNSVYLT